MRHNMKLWITTVAVSVASLAALATAGQATTVFNGAENSHRGGHTVSSGTVDPNPPARLLGSQIGIGLPDIGATAIGRGGDGVGTGGIIY